MAQIVIKSKEELARMPALADGTYTLAVEYMSKDTPPVKGGKSSTVIVKDGKYSDSEGRDFKDVDLEVFKKNLDIFDKVSSAQFTLDAVAKPDTAGAAKETPWLLYAAGAAVLYLILKGKKS